VSDSQTWGLIWFGAAVFFVAGEMAVPGTFILLPFGISAAVAGILAFIGVGVGIQWLAFIGVGSATFWVMWRYAKRFAAETTMPIGVGSDRLVGETGPVVEDIPAGPSEAGVVRIGAEIWRAESPDYTAIASGTNVEVVEVRGTRVIVSPITADIGEES
jgi:membrane protein implicated in regulation of membrane protease activity